MPVIIRTLCPDDHPQWNLLWRGYLEFYKAEIPDSVTELTWRRLLDPEAPVLGRQVCPRMAFDIVGVAHAEHLVELRAVEPGIGRSDGMDHGRAGIVTMSQSSRHPRAAVRQAI